MDILYGRNPVLEALRAGRAARKLVIADGLRRDARLSEILELARSRQLLVEAVSRRKLDDIAHTEHHQGVAGYFHTRAPLTVPQLLQQVRSPALLLVLDGIQDPQNLGAIARTAEASDVDAIVLTRHRSAAVTPAAAKAAAGATEHVPVAVASNLAQALQAIGDAGIWRVGLDASAAQRYDGFDYCVPLALVVGAEGAGLHQLTKRRCDVLVRIPMLGRVESLNAGASAAVLLYEVQRQRGFVRR